MTDRLVDPFKLLGKPSEWGAFGSSAHDENCDAERRAACDYFLRRIAKAQKRGNDEIVADLSAGASVALAGLFISAAGGPDALTEDAFDRWIAIMTFAWYQALGQGAGQA